MCPANAGNVWWSQRELTAPESALLHALLKAHHQSAFRDNPSSVTVANTAAGSGNLVKAIAAGLLTIGDRHAPIEQTYELLKEEMPWDQANYILKMGKKVPGWGGTFQKDQPDPLWNEVDGLFKSNYPEMYHKIELTTKWIHSHGKTIYPNPSAYTAAAAIVVGLNKKEAPYLFIIGRLDAWAQIATKYIEKEPVWESGQP